MTDKPKVRVLVCGGCNYDDAYSMDEVLHDVVKDYGGPDRVLIIHGAASGADALAAEFARINGIECVEFKADWKTHGKAAGPIRNRRMLEEGKPDLVVAFPGGRGTDHMTELARKAKVLVRYEGYEEF